MARIIIGIAVGFVVWSIVWVGGEQTLASLSPDWFGKHSLDAERAFTNGTALQTDPMISVVNLIRSFLTSIIAGYVTALVAGEFKRSTMILGVILLLVGIGVEYLFWNIAPVWYHVLFILFLIPMTILGGKLRRPS